MAIVVVALTVQNAQAIPFPGLRDRWERTKDKLRDVCSWGADGQPYCRPAAPYPQGPPFSSNGDGMNAPGQMDPTTGGPSPQYQPDEQPLIDLNDRPGPLEMGSRPTGFTPGPLAQGAARFQTEDPSIAELLGDMPSPPQHEPTDAFSASQLPSITEPRARTDPRPINSAPYGRQDSRFMSEEEQRQQVDRMLESLPSAPVREPLVPDVPQADSGAIEQDDDPELQRLLEESKREHEELMARLAQESDAAYQQALEESQREQDELDRRRAQQENDDIQRALAQSLQDPSSADPADPAEVDRIVQDATRQNQEDDAALEQEFQTLQAGDGTQVTDDPLDQVEFFQNPGEFEEAMASLDQPPEVLRQDSSSSSGELITRRRPPAERLPPQNGGWNRRMTLPMARQMSHRYRSYLANLQEQGSVLENREELLRRQAEVNQAFTDASTNQRLQFTRSRLQRARTSDQVENRVGPSLSSTPRLVTEEDVEQESAKITTLLDQLEQQGNGNVAQLHEEINRRLEYVNQLRQHIGRPFPIQ